MTSSQKVSAATFGPVVVVGALSPSIGGGAVGVDRSRPSTGPLSTASRLPGASAPSCLPPRVWGEVPGDFSGF